MARVFLCYRREDSAGWAGRIYDRLAKEFGKDSVFIDVDKIAGGQDFSDVIHKTILDCDVLIAVIGPDWLTVSDDHGARLDAQKDYVRREIAAALENDVQVIPVLVGNAVMPDAEQLPEELARLPRLHALEVTATRFDGDVSQLIKTVEPKSGSRRVVTLISAFVVIGIIAGIAIWKSEFMTQDEPGTLTHEGTDRKLDDQVSTPTTPAESTQFDTGPIAKIGGNWQGHYWYHENPSSRVPFTAEIEQDSAQFTGSIHETGLTGSIDLSALITGEDSTEGVKTSERVVELSEGVIHSDGRVTFIKQYRGQDNMHDRVEYAGVLSTDGENINGTWKLFAGPASGAFEMSRD